MNIQLRCSQGLKGNSGQFCRHSSTPRLQFLRNTGPDSMRPHRSRNRNPAEVTDLCIIRP